MRSLDLNLLVVLETLLAERHVSRAAERLALSQPAVSHALARLRQHFGDTLLVRRGRAMIPTSLALELQPRLSGLLSEVRQLAGDHAFDPARVQSVVRLAMSDYGSAVVLKKLLPILGAEAPGLTLHVQHLSRSQMIQATADGLIDAAIGVFPNGAPGLRHHVLFEEDFVCVMDRSHPHAQTLSLEAYLASDHMLVSMSGEPEGEVEAALSGMAKSRRIAAIIPHFTVAAPLLVGTSLVLTIARRTLEMLGDCSQLVVCDVPFDVPPFQFSMISRPITAGASANWLQQRIVDSFAVPA